MPTATAEPIEVAILVLAALAFAASLALFGGSWRSWRDAIADRRCEAIRTLAWMRARNEMIRLAISGSVVYSGYVQTTSAAPVNPAPTRPVFQVIWLLIAFACLVQSILNHRDTRHVIDTIERERAAGRMQ